MPEICIRPFARTDRDQLTTLVNAHLSAVTPGASVSVQGLLSALERDPGEFIVDPWVRERLTLVAEQRHRIVAAAQLLRYGSEVSVGEGFRGTGEIRWLVSWMPASFWPDADQAAGRLLDECLLRLDRWGVHTSYADGTIPGTGVRGLPEQWPHIAALYAAAGYRGGRTEEVLVATTDDLRRMPGAADGLSELRTLGINGTRFTALDGDTVLGHLEIDTNLGEAGRFSRGIGWADVGNLEVGQPHRFREVATWLLQRGAEWLELGGIARLLTYSSEDDPHAHFWTQSGFSRLTVTRRMLERTHGRG